MGWLQLGPSTASRSAAPQLSSTTTVESLPGKGGAAATHTEYSKPALTHLVGDPPKKYPFQPSELASTSLPFIPASVVTSKRRPGFTVRRTDTFDHTDLWIVVDNVVYDCSDFIDEHPGGRQVIASFLGEDCSWQFWRFHGRKVMEKYGLPLRIGRTEGVKNRFEEKAKYVGLRRLGDDY
jgi:hypothetical protein